jgi:glycerol 3-phosphatase-2
MPVGTWLSAADAPLAARYDVVLLDLDGVVYRGGEPIAGAAEAIAAVRALGVRVGFVTNNASRSAADVAAHLQSLSVPADAAEVVTSAQAAAAVLAGRFPAGAPVLVIGSPALEAEVRTVGLRPVTSATDSPRAVVNGYFDGLCYTDLREAALAIRAGAWWLATNLDATIPSPRGLQPGNGALTALLRTATDREPESAGKPARPLLAEAVRRTGARRPLFIGDRLDTDIAGAGAAEMDGMLVLTGVAEGPDLLAAVPAERPTYVARDLGGLLCAHPVVDRTPGEARCGGWRAYADGAALRVTGEGDFLDALRALAAVSWAYADEHGEPCGSIAGLPAL